MTEVPADLLHCLRGHGQEHLLTGWATLSEPQRDAFVGQLQRVGFAELERLYARRGESLADFDPATVTPIVVEDAVSVDAETLRVGEDCLRRGEVAVLDAAQGRPARKTGPRDEGL